MRQKVQRKDKIIQRISSRIWKEPKDFIWSWLESIFNWKVVTLSGKKTGIYKKVRDRKLQNHFSTSTVAKGKHNFLHTCLLRCLQISQNLISSLRGCESAPTSMGAYLCAPLHQHYPYCKYTVGTADQWCYISKYKGKKKKKGKLLNHWEQSSVASGQSLFERMTRYLESN